MDLCAFLVILPICVKFCTFRLVNVIKHMDTHAYYYKCFICTNSRSDHVRIIIKYKVCSPVHTMGAVSV